MAGQATHCPAAGAGLDLFEAGEAVQFPFVALLDAQLADRVRPLVVGLILVGPLLDGLLLGD
jgi:hypothetical protein